MSTGRIASWAILAATLAAAPAGAQNWPSNPPAAGPGKFPDAAAAPAAAPAGPGRFPPANAPQTLPAQPGAVPPPSQWGSNQPQHPAWGGGASRPAQQHPAWSGGGGSRPGGGPGQLPCADEIAPLSSDAQAKSQLVKNTVETKKGDRDALCKVFKTFSAAEAKLVKFVQEHGARCGFPADVIKGAKTNHGKTQTITNRICNAAAGPGAAPPPPSLSDALGTSRIPDSSNIKTGKGGTFDTLGGSAIAR
jgi:hypothetical protein